ncbi:hypothetical protein L1887_07358 [Cichorium endivia]|nr:hypothetical protein L1887_07358 [Cichorium endivia]
MVDVFGLEQPPLSPSTYTLLLSSEQSPELSFINATMIKTLVKKNNLHLHFPLSNPSRLFVLRLTCFSTGSDEPHSIAVTKSGQTGQTIFMSVYKTRLVGDCRYITITWFIHLVLLVYWCPWMGQSHLRLSTPARFVGGMGRGGQVGRGTNDRPIASKLIEWLLLLIRASYGVCVLIYVHRTWHQSFQNPSNHPVIFSVKSSDCGKEALKSYPHSSI